MFLILYAGNLPKYKLTGFMPVLFLYESRIIADYGMGRFDRKLFNIIIKKVFFADF